MTNPEIVISIIGAVLAAIIGSIFTMWLQRSQPWIGLISVDRDDTYLVPISQELINLIKESQWVGRKSVTKETVPLYELLEYTKYIEDMIVGMRKALDILNNLDGLLKQRDTRVDEQKKSLRNCFPIIF